MIRARRTSTIALALLVALASGVRGQALSVTLGGVVRDHAITVDDYFTQANLFEVAIAPDGRHVAYTDGRWQEATDDRKPELWVVDVATSKPQRLTFDRASERSLKWSPDGRWIYCLANRKREGEKHPPYDGKTQVWRVAPNGGEPQAVTRVEGGVSLYDLSGDGQTLYYTTDRDESEAEWKKLRQQFKDIQYGHGTNKVSVVWKLDLTSWRSEKVLDRKRYVRDLAASPDGRWVAMITTPDDRVVTFEGQSQVDVYHTEKQTVRRLPDRLFRAEAPSPYGWLEHLAWSADSRLLAFTVIFDGYPAEIFIGCCEGSQPSVIKVRRPDGLHVKGYGTPLQWRGKAAELRFLGEEKARVRLCCVTGVTRGGHGEIKTLTPGDRVVLAFSGDATGEHTALIQGDAKSLPDVFLLGKGEASRQLTRTNPQAETWKLPQLSVVSWPGAGGREVEGILELPPDYQAGQRVPLVVDIHGGPTTANLFYLEYWIYGRTLFPAKGYAVLSPNYRGSTGYGDAFVTELLGRENDVEVEDILKGVDALVERGVADPDRLGVMGWSNGGYLTNCVIAKTTRFKAASSGAGIVDTVMEWGINDEPAYPMVFKRGLPWQRADLYRKTSPTYQLDRIRTPTLIHVGGEDERCPPGHSRMLYRALKEYVKVPTQLLVYPGEPHGLMRYKSRKAKMEWDLAWFEKHLRGKK